MKKSLLVALLVFHSMVGMYTQPAFSQSPKDHDQRMAWWREARFGMFIHWGLYAVPAGEWNGKTGYGEWIRNSAQIPLPVYDQFVPRFNPTRFDADSWVKMARDAGMKYLVITSKHHDGFAMYDSWQSGFCVTATPFKKDPMEAVAAACRKYGLKLCFYYSIMDWHHPDYLPRRDWEKDRSTEGADYERYVQYMKAQLKELLTKYGDIGVLWFDGEWENTWNEKRGKDLYAYVRMLQPSIIINNRVGAGRIDWVGMTREGAFGGDFGTPEQQIPATGIPGLDWETCMTMNDHWGYNKADKNFKKAGDLLRMVADIASKGGNFLLNVGPDAEGNFPPESVRILDSIGQWMKINAVSIYGTQASPFKSLSWGRCTRKDENGKNFLYLHVFDWPASKQIVLNGLLNEPISAYLLADPARKSLPVTRHEDALTIGLPEQAPDAINSVIVLEIKGKPDMTEPPVIDSRFGIFTDSLRVPLSTDRDHVEIRYTLDGSDPVQTSPLYFSPVLIRQSVLLSARCFRDGKPVSGTVRKEFDQVMPQKASALSSNLNPPRKGLKYSYYEGSFDAVSGMTGLQPVKSGVLSDFLFDPRNREDFFGFDYSGFILIPETNAYQFTLRSDDGSCLYIDDQLVIDHDGLHSSSEKCGTVALEKGFHQIRVLFIESSGSDGLELFVQSPSGDRKKVPGDWLFQP